MTNIFITNFFFWVSKRKVLFCDQGSLPLTCRCCSTRLLRCMSMCLALSQVSLHRDVCPRLSDSNLSNRDTVSATQTSQDFTRVGKELGSSEEQKRRAKHKSLYVWWSIFSQSSDCIGFYNQSHYFNL